MTSTSATANGDRHVLFIGVDASHSHAMAAVPEWSSELGVPLRVKPVDVPVGAGSDRYERIVNELLADPHAAGAVVTGHKVGMYTAAAERCVYISPDAQQLRECTVLARGRHGLAAHATDVQSIGAEVDRIWPGCSAPVLCLGAGGSGAALCLHLLRRRSAPPTIVMCERDPDRAAEFADLFSTALRPRNVEVRVEDGANTWDDAVLSMPPGALIVNATGLGKTGREMPLTTEAVFPRLATVWDLNYRGPLPFLVHANDQAGKRTLRVHDGWRLFALGWLASLGALLNVHPPAGLDDTFVAIAEGVGK
jgi:shikimate 5-dehydrogenase